MLRIAHLFALPIAVVALQASPAVAKTPDSVPTMIKDKVASGKVPAGLAGRMEAVADAAKFSGEAAFAAPGFLTSISIGPGNAKGLNMRPVIWRWASVTKQIMAVMIMQEVAKGTIDLSKPVSAYLPKFKNANASKTSVEQLLRHQSGLPNPDAIAIAGGAFPAYYLPSYSGSRDPLSGYCAGQPTGEPGGQWAYNNCDYIVAGALLETVTGKSFAALFAERISGPLGMKTAGLFPTATPTAQGRIGGRSEPAIEFAAFGASAALYGSRSDLLKFDLALLNGRLLQQAELEILWQGKAELGFMALGQWSFDAKLKDCKAPVRLIERRGAIGGVQVRNFMMPERKAAFVMFTDQSESDFAFGEIWQGSGFAHDMLNAALCTPESSAKEAG